MADEIEQKGMPETEGPFEPAVENSLKKRQEQFEAPTHKNVSDKVDAFIRKSRDVARKFADNRIVEWIPVVSSLIRSALDRQKADTALWQGKDIDTGMKLSGKERAKMVVSQLGSSLWEDTKAKVDVVFLAAGGALGEKLAAKVGGKLAGRVVEKIVPGLAQKAIKAGGDRLVHGRVG